MGVCTFLLGGMVFTKPCLLNVRPTMGQIRYAVSASVNVKKRFQVGVLEIALMWIFQWGVFVILCWISTRFALARYLTVVNASNKSHVNSVVFEGDSQEVLSGAHHVEG